MKILKNILQISNKKQLRLLIVVCLLISFQPGNGQEIRVRSIIDSTYILIGDQINIKLEAELPVGYQLNFPQLKDTIIDKIEIINISPVDTITLANSRWRLIQDVLITSFDTGFYVIPSMAFVSGQPADTFRTKNLALEVFTMEIDTTKGITDIKLPIDAPLTLSELLPYILAGLILLITVLVIYRMILRARKNKPILGRPPKPAVPPHITAINELDKLASSKLWQQNKVKLYYSTLTEILRIYIEGRFRIFAMEQTTDEILEDLINEGLRQEDFFKKLKEILIIADLVKFAKWQPLPDENQSNLDNAYVFVNKSRERITDDDKNSKK